MPGGDTFGDIHIRVWCPLAQRVDSTMLAVTVVSVLHAGEQVRQTIGGSGRGRGVWDGVLSGLVETLGVQLGPP
ncbi:Uncharacterised protein [Mycobacteroides abscessus subsp. massiliense]|nr:Uncharacterised protein [Mycobacteroides abscessus subsp. massiliense]SLA12079.1 Uncharacterised protein [Mycobacteroides abscessus subsp. massiliense]SLA71474.1 Uncharacterised protein [Mycobacteroides abscessus subsp. massiliense]SLA78425.1 Uncharacterised protein [Mycobacteroides abscessus subsp. massiliense]SLA79862.1 Uncharacterised protein [Mycobacteroides abscessus subsp. massiliense]